MQFHNRALSDTAGVSVLMDQVIRSVSVTDIPGDECSQRKSARKANVFARIASGSVTERRGALVWHTGSR